MLSYYFRQTNTSRGVDDGQSKKKVSTWLREYFCFDSDNRLLCSVNECEDGLLWFSDGMKAVKEGKKTVRKPTPLSPPRQSHLSPAEVRDIPAEEYGAALTRYLTYKKAQDEQKAKEAEALEKLRGGMARAAHAAEEAGAAEPSPVETSLSQSERAPHPLPPSQREESAAPFLADFTVIDLEFQPNPHPALLEIAAIRYQNWEPVGELVRLVRFRGKLNHHVANLTGITAAQLWDAPEEKQVLIDFLRLAEGSLLVCHNIGADRTQLEAARTRQGRPIPLANPWLCTLALARKRHPQLPGHKLGELCQAFQIPHHGAHRALRDVQMCFEVLRYLHGQQPVGRESLHGAPKARKTTAKATATLFATAA